MSKKAILVITDGIGYSPKTTYNAFYHAKKPTYDYLLNNVPYSMIRTYGLSVGLPDSQMGNSEVGHMCIGSGRVLYQDLVRISLALQNDEIKSNQAFKSVANNCQIIHIGGLLSDGGVHSHISHLLGIAEICAKMQKQVFLHLITDGRDVLPQSALGYLDSIQSLCEKYDTIRVASLSGRFYAMDRDKRWERIEQAYDEMVCAKTPTTLSPSEYVKSQYKQGIFDEFITPVSFAPFSGMQDNEGFIFINFRSDRARQILQVLGDESFSGFTRAKAPRLQIATMCEYDASFTFPVLFSKEKITNTLAEVISKQGLRQFHTAETEKYAHITFFLNGGREEEFSGEKRELIPSPKVKTYDLQPQMSAPQVGDAVLGAMRDGYDFIVVNFANGDMVGHTGDFKAGIKAVESVDTELGRIINLARELDYSVVITSDHGNCEEMKDDRGNTLTNHTVGDVWCFIVDKEVKQVKASGGLDNIAPSVLKLMGLPKPQEMNEPLF